MLAELREATSICPPESRGWAPGPAAELAWAWCRGLGGRLQAAPVPCLPSTTALGW